MNSLSDTALSYLAAGLCVLPADRATKRPPVASWREYQKRLPTEDEVRSWFSQDHDALCIICGAVSGAFECIDFDQGGAAFPDFQGLVGAEIGMRLVCERTQSGGVHVFYRCEAPIEGNQKLAMDGGGRVLVETRGEGGLVLVAPSDGYRLFQSDLLSLPVLTADERAKLLEAARSLDRRPAKPDEPAPAAKSSLPIPKPRLPAPLRGISDACGFDLLPGEDFDERGDIRQLLFAHGWQLVGVKGNNESWKRPGKEGVGQSATFNGSVFYVFSSNAAPFEPGRGYGKFGVFAMLEYGGDMTAATAALAEAGYGRAAVIPTNIDLSGIVSEAESTAVEEEVPGDVPVDVEVAPEEPESKEPDPRPEPEAWSLYSFPGFIDELAAYTLRISPYTNRALAFSGALALLCFLCGRSYCTATGLSPLLYILALAGSAVGKEAPRAVNKTLLAACGLAEHLGEEFASGEGLEDSLVESPSMLYQSDEIAFLFESLKENDGRARSISSKLLRLYSSSASIYATRVTARKRAAKGGGKEEKAKPRTVVRPLPVIYGSATPEKFYAALNTDALENGLVGRCLVLEANAPRVRNRSVAIGERVPSVVLDGIEDLRRVASEVGDGAARPVAETEDATTVLSDFADECDKFVNSSGSGSGAIAGSSALWGRAWEKACKLSLLHAVSRRPGAPCIELEDAQAGVALARRVTSGLLRQIRLNLAGSPFEKSCKEAIRLLRSRNGGVTRTEMCKALRLPKRQLDEVVGFLVESGQVVQGLVKNKNGANRSAMAYRLVED